MPPSPSPRPKQSPQELAFARAHPELATLATAQIREAMAFERGLRVAIRREQERIEALREWAEAHGIDALPLE